jgi:hypothetical protein
MSLIAVVSLCISAAFMLTGAVLFVLSLRKAAQPEREQDPAWRAPEDGSDRVLWELGQDWPLVDPQTRENKLTRRGFASRLALGVFAAAAGWAATRGWADTRPLPRTAGSGPTVTAARTETGGSTQIALNGQQEHNDTHNDFETHGNNMTPHQDYTNPRNGAHFDVPHYDQDTGHFDLHNDA